MSREMVLMVEAPDTTAKVDFLTDGCSVTLKIETKRDGTKTLWVKAVGCDDRCSILLDEVVEVPEKDDRR